MMFGLTTKKQQFSNKSTKKGVIIMQLLEMMAIYECQLSNKQTGPVSESVGPISKDNPAYKQVVDVIEKIKKETMRDAVILMPKTGSAPKLLDSKIGGIPYCPNGVTPPPDDRELVVQINFSDRSIPTIQSLPKSGILQVFANSGYPMPTDVRYYPNITEPNQTEEDVILAYPYVANVRHDAVRQPVVLKGRKVKESLPLWRDAYPEYLAKYLDVPQSDNRVWELRDMIGSTKELRERVGNGYGHKLGGYHAFTQNDVLGLSGNRDYELLVQLDSDKYIRWGDNGIANWFIKPSDLKRLDFSDILANWDCY